MYDGPIIDAHHHIWEVKNYPWLTAPMEPKLFGAYEPLRQDYSVADLADDFKNQNVVKSVHIQANWGISSPVDETAWLQNAADRAGFPHGIIAYADLTRPEQAEELIKGHKKFANMRGIRHQIFWHEEEKWRACARPDIAASPEFMAGFGLLAPHGLSFELQIFPFHDRQVQSVVELLRVHRETPVILVHAGMLPLGRDAFVEPWRRGMAKLAQCANLHVKLSGLALLSQKWSVEQLRFVCAETINMFGIDRCIYGSNFPLERMWATYDELCDGMKQAVRDVPQGDQTKLFHDNAMKFYRL